MKDVDREVLEGVYWQNLGLKRYNRGVSMVNFKDLIIIAEYCMLLFRWSNADLENPYSVLVIGICRCIDSIG